MLCCLYCKGYMLLLDPRAQSPLARPRLPATRADLQRHGGAACGHWTRYAAPPKRFPPPAVSLAAPRRLNRRHRANEGPFLTLFVSSPLGVLSYIWSSGTLSTAFSTHLSHRSALYPELLRALRKVIKGRSVTGSYRDIAEQGSGPLPLADQSKDSGYCRCRIPP